MSFVQYSNPLSLKLLAPSHIIHRPIIKLKCWHWISLCLLFKHIKIVCFLKKKKKWISLFIMKYFFFFFRERSVVLLLLLFWLKGLYYKQLTIYRHQRWACQPTTWHTIHICIQNREKFNRGRLIKNDKIILHTTAPSSQKICIHIGLPKHMHYSDLLQLVYQHLAIM